MSLASDTITVVLAGGVGSRLAPLTHDRPKPAVPFGGQYRLIDFTLSNCLHSGLRRVLVLTQYKSHSLQNHLRDAWSLFNPALDEYISAVPSQLCTNSAGYVGTADAIHQNESLLKRSGAKYVLVLSSDHIYQMDYSAILRKHRDSGADVTVGCIEVSLDDARELGIMSTDHGHRIRRFAEKPLRPDPTPYDPARALASMGIYVFSLDVLCRELDRDAADTHSSHDFGKDLLPRLVHTHAVVGHRFGDGLTSHSMGNYWRDVGTIDAYYRANMDLVQENPPLDLYAESWPIHKLAQSVPPARIERDEFGRSGAVVDSLISDGVIISGATVCRSILSPRVKMASGASVDGCILFDNVNVGEGSRLHNCIVDEGVTVPPGECIGMNTPADAERFAVSEGGIVVLTRDSRFKLKPQATDTQPAALPTAFRRSAALQLTGLPQPWEPVES